MRVKKKFWEEINAYFYLYDTDRVENNASNNYSIVGYVFVAAVKILPSRCLATESLSSNDKSIYTYTPTDGRDL